MIANAHISRRALAHILHTIKSEVQSGNDSLCMATIGQRSGYTLRTVQYAIPELERSGLLIVERRPPGHPHRYRFPTP
jgi:hypothetical protein